MRAERNLMFLDLFTKKSCPPLLGMLAHRSGCPSGAGGCWECVLLFVVLTMMRKPEARLCQEVLQLLERDDGRGTGDARPLHCRGRTEKGEAARKSGAFMASGRVQHPCGLPRALSYTHTAKEGMRAE